MSADTEVDRLAEIERKLDEVLAKLAAAEQAFTGFVSGPAIGKMFRAIAGNGKGQ